MVCLTSIAFLLPCAVQLLTSHPSFRQYLDRIRTRAGPFTNKEMFDGDAVVPFMDSMKIL